jgi:YVTN family beta-propeller protein
MLNFALRLTAALLLAGWPARQALAQASYVHFEGKQTSPVRLSPDGTRLFAVNSPDSRLSVFDVSQPSNPRLLAEIPVGLEPASVNPRNNDEAWVVNELSDSVSIVSVSQGIVTDTLYVKDEPADVVFAGNRAFVSAARKNLIAVFDVTTHAQLASIPLLGENPRAMAVNTNGTKVYAAFALSGNHTTIIPATNAPPQTNTSPPMNTNLPAPPQVGRIVDASDPAWFTDAPRTNVIKYTMPDNDVAEVDTATLTATRYFTNVGTVLLGLAIRPGTGELYVSGTDARNKTRFEPNLRSTFETNQISRVNPASAVVERFDLNPGFLNVTNMQASFRSNALAQPTAMAFAPDGSSFYVAAFGSDRVAHLDAANPANVLARIELCPTATGSAVDARNKRGTRGLALNAAAQRLYVLNRLANTLAIVDTSTDTFLKEIPVGSHDPTPAVVRQGRGFLYDAKLSGNGTVACASCHVDGEMDLIAWDLGDPTGALTTNRSVLLPLNITNTAVFHPMKGPMTTQTLRGLNALDPLHWRGDRTNFTHFNGAFASLLGGVVLSDTDIGAYRDFINTINFEPNPNQNLDRSYPTNFAGGNADAGRNAFFFTNYTTGLTCNSCHTGPPGPGSNRLIIPASALQESQDFKVPHLRNIYQKMDFNNATNAVSVGGFGITHDGTDPTLQVFLSRPVFVNIRNDATIKNNLAAFVQCFDTGTAPAVGYTFTLTPTNVTSAAAGTNWTLLEGQAAATNVDLVVKGTFGGQIHGWTYQPVLNNYRPDSTNLATQTRAQLAAKVQAGDTLTLMGVPPGSGVRLGIDRDENGVLDGDEPPPRLNVTRAGSSTVLDWPYSAAGYVLESSPVLPGAPWTNAPEPVEIIGSRNYVTNGAAAGASYFRLRRN